MFHDCFDATGYIYSRYIFWETYFWDTNLWFYIDSIDYIEFEEPMENLTFRLLSYRNPTNAYFRII